MKRPPPNKGMRHVALFVRDFNACEKFYVDLLGMKVEWRPDPNNVYLSGGCDNLALHRAVDGVKLESAYQRLDHIGFILEKPEDVDEWFAYFLENEVSIRNKPKTHRDGARSFYCFDPDGVVVQMIFHPPISSMI